MDVSKNNHTPMAVRVEQKTAENQKKKHIVREYAESIIIAVILALIIRTFVVQAFKIPSASMEDTMLIGDHLLVNKFIYGMKIPFTDKRIFKIRDPRRGDVIVFEYPVDPSKDFIKRVIGTPGDVVQVINKKVYVNGKLYVNPHEVHKEPDIIPKYRTRVTIHNLRRFRRILISSWGITETDPMTAGSGVLSKMMKSRVWHL